MADGRLSLYPGGSSRLTVIDLHTSRSPGQLSSVTSRHPLSAYLILPTLGQEQVFSRIMQVLPATVEITADITVHIARRRCEQ